MTEQRGLTRYYTFEEALRKLEELPTPELSLDELVLLVLGLIDKPINGRVVFHKEIFLIYNELKDKVRIIEPQFIKYKYGPFSPQIAALVDLLEDAGYLRIVNRRSVRASKIILTERGKELAYKVIKRLEEKLGEDYVNKLRKLRIGWDQLGHDGILRYVYQAFPEYREKSAKKDKYIHIDWGVLEA